MEEYNDEYNDEDIYWIGKYTGTRLGDVPIHVLASYQSSECCDMLGRYIQERIN